MAIDVFGANLAISGCASLSQSLDYTFIELVTVKNAGSAIRISKLSIIVPEILDTVYIQFRYRDTVPEIFPVLAAISGCRSS